jgi:hypothetical protein
LAASCMPRCSSLEVLSVPKKEPPKNMSIGEFEIVATYTQARALRYDLTDREDRHERRTPK